MRLTFKSLILSALALWILTACSGGPSPEAISTLEATENSAADAEKELATLEAENERLASELERAKQILAANKEERKMLREQKGQ